MSSNTLVLGDYENSSGPFIKYAKAIHGAVHAVNKAWMMNPMCAEISVETSELEVGDFIHIATDHHYNTKKVNFGHPVIWGPRETEVQLFEDGVVELTDKWTFWWDGYRWTPYFNTNIRPKNFLTQSISTASDMLITDFENIDGLVDLMVEITLVGGGGQGPQATESWTESRHPNTGNIYYTRSYGAGGSGASGAKVKFVWLKSDDEVAPTIKPTFVAGAGESASLTINDTVVITNIPGGKNDFNVKSDPVVFGDVSKMLYHAGMQGGEGGCNHHDKPSSESQPVVFEGVVHAIRDRYYWRDRWVTDPDIRDTQHYGESGGASILSDKASGFGAGGNVFDRPLNAGMVLSIRPATPEEITAQRLKNQGEEA